MGKLVLSLLVLASSASAFAQEISVTINGRTYQCGERSAPTPQPAPYLVRDYCDCDSSGAGIYFQRVGIMSDGTTTIISRKSLTPSNGSYYPAEVLKQCQEMVRQCR